MTHHEQELADAYAAGVEAGRRLGQHQHGRSTWSDVAVAFILFFGGALYWLRDLAK